MRPLPRQHRPWIAHSLPIGLEERDEALDRFVEQRRPLQIEHVDRLEKEGQAARRLNEKSAPRR